MIKSIKQAGDLEEKKVLVRVDFNVPLKNGEVEDDNRLKATLPTIKYLIEQQAKIILITHLGRPEGQMVEDLKVEPIAKRLAELLGQNVAVWPDFTDKDGKLDTLKNGEVVMLQNIRFSPDENKDTGTLSRDLAKLADIFVLDGFGVAHRAGASVTGIAKHLPSYAGLLLQKEINGLNRVIANPTNPFVVVLGGAKIETKIPVIKNLSATADFILLGGGLVNTYLKAKGYNVGGSLVSDDYLKPALEYCEADNVILPVDVVVGNSDGTETKVMDINSEFGIKNSEFGIYDIGPKTIKLFRGYIDQAQTLVWNGAMGYFEQKPYDVGTLEVARLVAKRSKSKDCFGVIGGGETLQSMDLVGLTDKVDLVSTGGGAMLEFLSGEKLPGLVALQ